jgi:hypothetical protein
MTARAPFKGGVAKAMISFPIGNIIPRIKKNGPFSSPFVP